MGKLYAYMAEENGKVTAKTDKKITIEYSSGKIISTDIGTQHGLSEGVCYPHRITSDLNVGDKFKQGDPISYNTGFFERDWLNKDRIILKTSKIIKTALTVNNEIHEDSSAISKNLSKEVTARITKVKSFVIDFSKNIINLQSEGSLVEPNTVLLTILDETSSLNNLTEDTIKLLSNISNISPKAKTKGIIDKYEMYYNGDIADMSPTLKKIAKKLNAETIEKTKNTELELTDNKVNTEYRVAGKNLLPDTLELKIYITTEVNAGIGDKFVYASQLKSVIGDVYSYNIHTENGAEVEAMFGFKSIANRITLSPYIIGTTNTLLKEVSKQVADIYFS